MGARGRGEGARVESGVRGASPWPEMVADGGGNCELRRGIAPAWGHDWRGNLRGLEEGNSGDYIEPGMERDRGVMAGNREGILPVFARGITGERRKTG